MTIREFLKKKGLDKDLLKLLSEVLPLAIVRVREAVESGGSELAGSENISGEKQIALDVRSDMIFGEVLKESGIVASYVSEEQEEMVVIDDKRPFTLVFDPLDGSSLVNVNFAVGTVFGVYAGGNPVGKTPGDQLAAGFVVYGPRTTLVLCPGNGKGVHEFLLGHSGEFSLAKENLRVADKGKYFAPGNLRAGKEREDYRKLLEHWVKEQYTLRYSGGMVPDVNHILLKGNGIFTYPPYSETPHGKLRLLYECGPMAFVMEEAGGAATDGEIKITEKKTTELHQRSPILIGSKDEVAFASEMLKGI